MPSSTTASATRASATSRCRSRSSLGALLFVVGCNGAAPVVDARSVVGGEPIDPLVVAHVAARDGLDEASARAKVVQTLQLVAAARAELGEDAELDPARASQLRRTALARLVLHEEFEPTHRPEDIPADDPLLVRARAPGRYSHPVLHDVCQVIVVPKDAAPETWESITADPAWRARAEELMAPAIRHLRDLVDLSDPHACELVARDVPLEKKNGDGIELRYERLGFDLESCNVPRDADGTCSAPTLDPTWVATVREGEVPGWRGPFFTRFGVHFAFVQQVVPAILPEQAGFEQSVRAAIHREWEVRELQSWLAALRTEYAAQTVVAAEDGPR
jgi:hypothetical protein